MARLLGRWQMALPSSVAAARQTVVSFLAFAALPTTAESFTVQCPPVSPAEKVPAGSYPASSLCEAWTAYSPGVSTWNTFQRMLRCKHLPMTVADDFRCLGLPGRQVEAPRAHGEAML
jgi:hypothetical protein